jgi:hypothetical protein
MADLRTEASSGLKAEVLIMEVAKREKTADR